MPLQLLWTHLRHSILMAHNTFPTDTTWLSRILTPNPAHSTSYDLTALSFNQLWIILFLLIIYDSSGCIIPHKGKDILGFCPDSKSFDIWDRNLGDEKANLQVWRGRNGWWWDGCAGCRWRIGNTLCICTVFWVFRVRWMWWGMADRGGLGIWSVDLRVDDWVSACRKVEVAGARCKGRIERLGKSVCMMTWKCLVYILNRGYSGMFRGTS